MKITLVKKRTKMTSMKYHKQCLLYIKLFYKTGTFIFFFARTNIKQISKAILQWCRIFKITCNGTPCLGNI